MEPNILFSLINYFSSDRYNFVKALERVVGLLYGAAAGWRPLAGNNCSSGILFLIPVVLIGLCTFLRLI